MKLPSIKQLAQNTLDTFTRFPFAIFSAAAGTGAAMVIMQIEFHRLQDILWLYNIAAVAFLGIPVFTAANIIAEKENWKFGFSSAFKLCLLCLLAVYFFFLPYNIFECESVQLIRYFLFVIAAHLIVSLAPFAGRNQADGFWEYNKTLFLRFLTAALYSGVLYSGLSIALLAIANLFSVEIKGERYLQLWWFIAGIFNTCFFLSGVPHVKDLSKTETQYPKGLKIFSQYVLIPLVAVYLCILYAYMGKIIIEWEWPKGWVGYLVLGFSITGVLSLLLIHPIKDKSGNLWMANIWRWFYIVLLPLTVLLLLAIWRRVSEYGLTERRYFVIILGIWLAGIAVYFLISKNKKIIIIPTSLCAITLLSSFGPWGAFDISEHNQINRLEDVLIKNNMLVNNKARKAGSEISFTDLQRINSIVRYLAETHGVGVLQPWFDQKLDTVTGSNRRNHRANKFDNTKRVMDLLGVRYVNEWEREQNNERERFYTFRPDTLQVVALDGYQFLIHNVELNYSVKKAELNLDGEHLQILLNKDTTDALLFRFPGTGEIFSIDLSKQFELLYPQYAAHEYGIIPVPKEIMSATANHGRTRLQIFFKTINISVKGKKIYPRSMAMDIVISAGKK